MGLVMGSFLAPEIDIIFYFWRRSWGLPCTPVRHRKTACFEALVLEPLLLNLAAASCYFIASLVGGLRCNASRLLRMCWSSRGLPRRFLAPFNASSEK